MTPPAGPRQPGRAVGLPQYVWDTRLRNYVARDTGRMVKRAAIQEALGQVCDRGAETLAAIAQAGQAGTLTPRQFYEAMQREVKQLYSASAALGKGGWAQMTASDWGKVGRELRDEYGRLAKFAAGLADGTISEAQAIARARLYADSAYRLYWQNWAAQQADLGNDEEHFRTVGDERVCFPVWMPIATRRGALAIGDVLPGDDVLTRAGWRKVQATTRRWYTGRMVRVTTDSHTLIATADHPVWTLEKGWLECGNLNIGDRLETLGQQHVEVRGVADISLADAQHPPTVPRQVTILPGIIGGIGVPVGAVDFQGHAQLGQEEVDAKATDRGLLEISDSQTVQRQTHGALDAGLASERPIASETAEASIRVARQLAKLGTAVVTRDHDRRPTTGLRAKVTVEISLRPKDLTAAFAGYVLRFRETARTTADGITGSLAALNRESHTAFGADFCHEAIGRALGGQALSRAAPLATGDARLIAIERASTNRTSQLLAALLGRMITGAATEGVLAAPSARTLKGLTAPFAHILKHDAPPITRIGELYHRWRGNAIQVYDLAVEGEHEFYANGILVHNCPICLEIERRGWQPLGSLPRPGEPHPGDRCALEFRNSQAAKPAQTLQPARKPEPRRATIGTVPPGPPPRKPGAGAARARLTALTLESLALAEELRRPLHYGPGPHSDGSPQAVHGGGGAESPDSRAVAAKLTAAGIENLESGNCWVMAAATYEALRQGGQQPAIIDWSGHVDAATRTPDGGWLVHTVNGAVPFAEHPMTRLKRMRAPWRVHRDPNAMIANLIGEDGILPPRQQRTVSDNLRKASRIAGARWRIPEAMALHYGPGPHASGSPQSVHAGGANPPPKPTTARPKRARERVPGAQQRLEAAVKTGKVERIEELDGGTTGAVKAEYDGFLTVFKADRGEGIAANEVAARRLALLLGDDVVPPTTYARLMDEDGSAQAFVDDLMTGGDIEAEHMAMVITDRPKLDARNVETTLALDVIMGNRDRNPGNWGIDAQGRFWAIDHGYARWKAVSTTFRLGREPLPALPYNSLGEFLVRSNRAAPAGKEPYKRLTASEMPWTWEIEPARLREWRAITREQFEAAILDPASPRNIRNRPDYTRTSYDVKPEIAWANFEALRASGKIALT